MCADVDAVKKRLIQMDSELCLNRAFDIFWIPFLQLKYY